MKRFGLIITKTAGRTFTHRAADVLDRDSGYAAFASPILAVLHTVLDQIRCYDRQLRAIARDNETVSRLMTIPGAVQALCRRRAVSRADATRPPVG